MLVGRTKILKMHSPLWLENGCSGAMAMRLRLPPSTNGSCLALAPGDVWLSKSEVALRSCKPGEGEQQLS